MKRKLLLVFFMCASTLSFAQFSTNTVTLGSSGMSVKIDTNTTTVTLTLAGPTTGWFGVGFGGSSMSSVSDMFIWNSTANRDYNPSGFQSAPSADAVQSWTITSDNVVGTTRTLVATRNLVSSGDFTFTNNTSNINIIYARGSTNSLSSHGNNPHAAQTLTRTALGVEDFSLNASAVYPNPSNGNFTVKSKTTLDRINIYTQTGAFV
ncbi:MAG: secretion protein, partial [Flavobacterium sp.]